MMVSVTLRGSTTGKDSSGSAGVRRLLTPSQEEEPSLPPQRAQEKLDASGSQAHSPPIPIPQGPVLPQQVWTPTQEASWDCAFSNLCVTLQVSHPALGFQCKLPPSCRKYVSLNSHFYTRVESWLTGAYNFALSEFQ